MPFVLDATERDKEYWEGFSLLCDAEVDLNKYDDLLTLYGDDFDRDRLESQLHVLHSES